MASWSSSAASGRRWVSRPGSSMGHRASNCTKSTPRPGNPAPAVSGGQVWHPRQQSLKAPEPSRGHHMLQSQRHPFPDIPTPAPEPSVVRTVMGDCSLPSTHLASALQGSGVPAAFPRGLWGPSPSVQPRSRLGNVVLVRPAVRGQSCQQPDLEGSILALFTTGTTGLRWLWRTQTG